MLLALVAIVFSGSFFHVSAAEDPSLKELMEGFESEDTSAVKEEEKKKDDIRRLMEGFEDEVIVKKEEEIEDKLTSFSLDGYLKHGISYNFAHAPPPPGETDWRGLSRFRPEIQLELKAKLATSWQVKVVGNAFYDAVFAIKGREEFTGDVLDNREQEAEFGESYILGSLSDDIDVRFGRQIMVWGKSDTIRITDILNPLDLREPGRVDIENLRLPVASTKLDYYFGHWDLSAILIHEIRFNKTPAFGSDFFSGPAPPPEEDVPSDSPDHTEFGAALGGVFSGWDMSIYFADVFNDLPHQEIDSTGNRVRKHARINLFGSAVNIAMGNWLFKSELAYLDGFKFFHAPGRTFSRLDALVGFEYAGFHETMISFELANRHLFDFTGGLEEPPDIAAEDEFQTAFRLSREFLNDTLTVALLAQTFGILGEDGALQRISAEYDLTDALELSGGVIFYSSGDLRQFQDIGDNDRFFFEMKYNF